MTFKVRSFTQMNESLATAYVQTDDDSDDDRDDGAMSNISNLSLCGSATEGGYVFTFQC